MFPTNKKKEQIDYIKRMLQNDDRWLYRALVVLYKRQTPDEKMIGETKELNGVGFNALDAGILSVFAKIVIQVGTLSKGQKELTRRLIGKYSNQLWEISKEKEKLRR